MTDSDKLEVDVLKFTASVAQVKTLADGGIRLSLDLPETAIDTAAAMMKAKQAGAVLECAVVVVELKPVMGGTQVQDDRKDARHFTPYAKAKA